MPCSCIICRSSADSHLHQQPPAAAVHTADRLDTGAETAAPENKVVALNPPGRPVGVLTEHNLTAVGEVPERALEAEVDSAEDILAVREGNSDDLAGSLVMYPHVNKPRGYNSRLTCALDLGHGVQVGQAGRLGIVVVVESGSFVCSGRLAYHRRTLPSLVGQSLIVVTFFSEAHQVAHAVEEGTLTGWVRVYAIVVLVSMKGMAVGSQFEQTQEEDIVVWRHSEAGRQV